MEDFLQRPIIFSLGTTSIVGNKVLKRFVFYSPIKSNTLKISSYYEVITNVPVLIAYTAFMTNVSGILSTIWEERRYHFNLF
jgi:hypothetical protein